MIAAAIRCLAEEGGSSEAAISEYIRTNYDDIPWGHDRLLPYYLNKLTEHGEFVVGSPGRYMTAYDDGTSKPAPAPEPCSVGCSLELVAALEARSRAADAGGDGSPVRRRRGRPPKRRRRGGLSSRHGPEDGGEEGGSVVRRRRGRRPQKRIEADVSQADDGNNCGDAGSSDLAEAPPSLQPKHAEALPPEPNIVVDPMEAVLALPWPGPSTVAEDEAEAIKLPNEETGKHGSSVAKRRRGRPPKRKPKEEALAKIWDSEGHVGYSCGEAIRGSLSHPRQQLVGDPCPRTGSDTSGTHAWLSHRSIRGRDRQVGGVHGGRCRWNCPLPPQPRRSTRFRYVASDRGRRSFGVRAADTEFAVTPANRASLAARLRRRSLKKAKPVKRITRRYNGRPIRAPPITATASVPHLSLCAPQYP
ncbi:hypothetical protein GW17_00041570 [Ensete ventricosum]|nr:hypothetical protein GW17_00041570 [Ensete ventricosum]